MRFIAMVAANIKMTIRNKQALFFLFMFPILFMVLFGMVFGQSQDVAKISIVDQDKSALAMSITKSLKKVEKLEIEEHDRGEGLDKLKKGKVDAVLVLKKDFAKDFPKRPAAIHLYYDPASTRSQMMRGTIGAVLGGIERSMVKSPPLITVKSKSVQSHQLAYIDFLLPGILAMSLMNSGLYGLANVMVARREKGVLRRLKLTPLPLSQYIGAGILNQLLVSLVQAALLVLIGHYIFGVKIVGSINSLVVLVVAGSLCFITIGFVIASFAKTSESAVTLGNLVGMPMMFLGGVFFPVDDVPNWVKPIVKAMPLKYLADALRAVMVQGQSLSSVIDDLVILLAVTFAAFMLAIKFFRWESSNR
ncbi:MAG: ABC transporter permease [Actinomycetota bacterium]|nr:ABC transporter permease [Actinomycetota bacterium]